MTSLPDRKCCHVNKSSALLLIVEKWIEEETPLSLSLSLTHNLSLSLSSFIVMTINRSLIFQARLFHKKRKGWDGNWKLTLKSETMGLEVNRGRLHTWACNSKLEFQLRRCQKSFGLKTLARCSLIALNSTSIHNYSGQLCPHCTSISQSAG